MSTLAGEEIEVTVVDDPKSKMEFSTSAENTVVEEEPYFTEDDYPEDYSGGEIVEDKDYVWTTKYLKDDKVTQKTTKQKDGSYSSVQNYYYDKNWTLTKTIEKHNNGNVYTRHYYKSGNVSKEICGGPHVNNTRELGHFKIVKEEASSAGVRRIKAILE